MTNRIARQISEILKHTGELLKKSPEEQAVVARQSIRKIEDLSEESDNPHLVYLSYFLGLYVDDLWSNFAVDSSYGQEIKDEDVTAVLSHMGDGFAKIGKCLMVEDYHGCYNVYVNLVYDYLKCIESIQKRLSGVV